jgi:hypothetical protein
MRRALISTTCMLALLAAGVSGCSSHGRGERAGRAVDRGVDDVDDKADKVGDAIEDTAEDTGDAIERGADRARDGMK